MLEERPSLSEETSKDVSELVRGIGGKGLRSSVGACRREAPLAAKGVVDLIRNGDCDCDLVKGPVHEVMLR